MVTPSSNAPNAGKLKSEGAPSAATRASPMNAPDVNSSDLEELKWERFIPYTK